MEKDQNINEKFNTYSNLALNSYSPSLPSFEKSLSEISLKFLPQYDGFYKFLIEDVEERDLIIGENYEDQPSVSKVVLNHPPDFSSPRCKIMKDKLQALPSDLLLLYSIHKGNALLFTWGNQNRGMYSLSFLLLIININNYLKV